MLLDGVQVDGEKMATCGFASVAVVDGKAAGDVSPLVRESRISLWCLALT